MQESEALHRVKRAFQDFLQDNLSFKQDVYEKSLALARLPLPDNYLHRLKYEQDEVCALLDTFLTERGLQCGDVLVDASSLKTHWVLVEDCLFPRSCMTWMEWIFGPIFPLFHTSELNDFVMEFHGETRETIIQLFLKYPESWDYAWMNWYKDVCDNPEDYEEDFEFPRLPRKKTRCLGYLRGCENYSDHFCDECVEYFDVSKIARVEGGDDFDMSCM